MSADVCRSSGASTRGDRAAALRTGVNPALARRVALALVPMVLLLAATMPLRLHAQSYGEAASTNAQPVARSVEFLPQEQLDALLAPIALYPDDLLSQVLIASTYPLEVIEAARFVQQNPGLTGSALDDALRDKRWDPSVLSLAAFPQVLAMMSDQLEWTQQLGDAFLANQQQVMDTVQALRSRAQATGTLQDSDQQRVYVEDQEIVIEPAQADDVYVPVYDPQVVYGPWWVPAYQPFFWYPPAFYGYPVRHIGIGIVWGRPCHVNRNHWGWAHPRWQAGSIRVTAARSDFFNRPQYRNLYRANDVWRHAPEHRHGVAYASPVVRQRYVNVERRAADARREVRAGRMAGTPGREAPPRAVIATPQGMPAYRQVPADVRRAPEPRMRQTEPHAPQSVAVPAYQEVPQQRGAPQWRGPPPTAVPRVTAAPPPAMPRIVVAPPPPTMPRAVVAAPPTMPRVVVPAPQSVSVPGTPAVRVAPQPAPAAAERGRAVRQPGPADAGDSGSPRGR
ncbi:MAG: DUF3300 domain-containing protein [Casimicrobiaceae bacterium]